MVDVAVGRPEAKTDGLAVVAVVLAVLSVASSTVLVGVVLGGAAFMMGMVSIKRIGVQDGRLKGGRLAAAGAIGGLIGFALSIALPMLIVMAATPR